MSIDDTGTLHILSKESSNPKMEINIDQCIEGMLMAETLNNNMGAIIILENTKLDSATINRLKRLGIQKVKVYQKLENSSTQDINKKFTEVYTRNLTVIREVFLEIYSGKPLDMEKIQQLSGSIMELGEADGSCLKNKERFQNFDEHIYSHSVNVSMLSCLLAKWLKLDKKQMEDLIKAGLLHDIGKTKINLSILNKYEQLSEQENEQLRKHPEYGRDIIMDSNNTDNNLAQAILMHHEREDGSGYPSGVKSDGINELARIISVADLFDNLTSGSHSRKALNPFNAFEVMQSESFKGYSTEIILKLLESAPNYFLGEKFFLNTGEVGEIIFINPQMIHRPLIKVGEQYIDLVNDKGITLESML